MLQKVIEFKEVVKEYTIGKNKLKAVDNISFDITQGEFVVILGPSGAGKSTLLNLLGGMDYATSGEIIVNGKNIVNLNDDALTEYRAENVGFVFQFYNLIPTLTALENVALTKNIVKNPINPKEVLASVGLAGHENQFPTQLSGGEQQRVSIARALAKNPTMLLCDEPTGALDSETGIVILTLLQRMSQEKNKTVIIVTHNSALADAADKVIRIKNGKIREIIVNETPKPISEVNW
jgi:putative ABC transport system ATP-binding protein